MAIGDRGERVCTVDRGADGGEEVERMNPCFMPDLFPDIFLPYHFWRFYDEYWWPFDYTYDDYGEGNTNRECPDGGME